MVFEVVYNYLNMGWRFRRSINILPGVRLNIGKKSMGVSIGGKGMRYSVNTKGQRRVTTSILGTGISYSTSLDNKDDDSKR